MIRHAGFHFTAIALVLGAIAAAARAPASSDRQIYEQIGRHGIVLDCHDVHCFRVLAAVTIEHLPGPSAFKWKAYAVLTSSAAALAIGHLCLVLGLPTRLATLATWIAGTGFAPMQAVFDPHTSDPLMYLAGPLMAAALLRGRIGRATVIGALGVLAKEFAAAPLWIFTLMSAVRRRWDAMLPTLLGASSVTLVWMALQTLLMTLYNYSYGNNPSVNLSGGGYFAVWVGAIGWQRAALYLFTTFGALYPLLAAGLFRAGADARLLALCSLPAAAAFAYVQQPDRSLSNFQFVVIPIAVLTLEALPEWLCGVFVLAFAISNLRLGEPQPLFVAAIRIVMLAVSLLVAMRAVAVTLRWPVRDISPGSAVRDGSRSRR
jgi:hypothetical protein